MKKYLFSVFALSSLILSSCQMIPSLEMLPSLNESLEESSQNSVEPTIEQTQQPTVEPTLVPTTEPSGFLTDEPTEEPTIIPSSSETPVNPLEGTYDISIWVPSDGLVNLTCQQIDRFEQENPGVVINEKIDVFNESEVPLLLYADIDSSADMFFFNQDQLERLVSFDALTKLGNNSIEIIKESNDLSAINAVSLYDNMYGYPATSDNGYLMYYDKSVIKESSIDSLEAIIKDCEAAERKFSFECETSAWYNVSWFFATGCHSDWITDKEGRIIGVKDNFNSQEGLIALKGMQKLLKSPCYYSSSQPYDFNNGIPSAVVISGTWSANAVKDLLGDNYGATDLPSFEVDGKSYHLGSFSGNKILGTKHQMDEAKAKVINKLALWLTNEQCQLERYHAVGWGPSNLLAQQNEDIKSDLALSALLKQSKYAVPQREIHGSWWDIAKYPALIAKEAETDEELYDALIQYEQRINELFNFGD